MRVTTNTTNSDDTPQSSKKRGGIKKVKTVNVVGVSIERVSPENLFNLFTANIIRKNYCGYYQF